MIGALTTSGDLIDIPTTISTCPLRQSVILTDLATVRRTQFLPARHSESMHGKLMHCIDQLFGMVGRAHTRAFRRRAHEPGRVNLNPQLQATIDWWLNHLATCPPKEVPLRLEDLPYVISYGDGEGGDGRIGAVVVSNILGDLRPRVGSTVVPSVVRSYWAWQRELLPSPDDMSDEPHDIQQVEAVCPAAILHSYPQISHCLWLHFVDNNGALATLVKGSASVNSDEVILGYTWSLIATRRIWAYFDRVDTHANIADIPSRTTASEMGDPLGLGWVQHRLKFPSALRSAIVTAHPDFA